MRKISHWDAQKFETKVSMLNFTIKSKIDLRRLPFKHIKMETFVWQSHRNFHQVLNQKIFLFDRSKLELALSTFLWTKCIKVTIYALFVEQWVLFVFCVEGALSTWMIFSGYSVSCLRRKMSSLYDESLNEIHKVSMGIK